LLPSTHSSPPWKFVSDFFITQSITIANSNGHKMHPCRTTVTTSNQSLHTPFNLTQLLLPSYRFWMMVIMVSGIPYCLSIDHIDGLCKQSKAFPPRCYFLNDLLERELNIWSLHYLHGLNPACSVRICVHADSGCSSSRWMIRFLFCESYYSQWTQAVSIIQVFHTSLQQSSQRWMCGWKQSLIQDILLSYRLMHLAADKSDRMIQMDHDTSKQFFVINIQTSDFSSR